jgi:hypothetical protein
MVFWNRYLSFLQTPEPGVEQLRGDAVPQQIHTALPVPPADKERRVVVGPRGQAT